MVLLAACLSSRASSGAGKDLVADNYSLPFTFFWEWGDHTPPYPFEPPAPFVLRRGGPKNNHTELTISQQWGRWPMPYSGRGGQRAPGAPGLFLQGGVPQSPQANLSLHLQDFVAGIDGLRKGELQGLPRDFDGNAVIDMEAWSSVWELNGCPERCSSPVQPLSRALVRGRHPGLNASELERRAKEDFEDAANRWMVATLQLGRRLRPRAHWGYYGVPAKIYAPCTEGPGGGWRCGYDHPSQGAQFRRWSDALSPVVGASTALYPSLYVAGADSWPEEGQAGAAARNRAWIGAVVREAVRIGRGRPVLPYAWSYYANLSESGVCLALSSDDQDSELLAPYDAGAAGVVLYADAEKRACPAAFKTLTFGTIAPRLQAFMHRVRACAEANCTEHGRCMPLGGRNCSSPAPGRQ